MDNWKAGLVQSGTYYEGFVEDVEQVLQGHQQETVTCYGTRHSRIIQRDDQKHKENVEPEKCKVIKQFSMGYYM